MVDSKRRSLVLVSGSPAETARIGRILGEGLAAGDVVALRGEMGAGKTCLTQGIARGLGVPEEYAVTSPTFTLVNEYPGRKTVLYHADLYRLQGAADLAELGYREYLCGAGVLVIEWADRITETEEDASVCVTMDYQDENSRRMEISGCPDRIDRWERIIRDGGT